MRSSSEAARALAAVRNAPDAQARPRPRSRRLQAKASCFGKQLYLATVATRGRDFCSRLAPLLEDLPLHAERRNQEVLGADEDLFCWLGRLKLARTSPSSRNGSLVLGQPPETSFQRSESRRVAIGALNGRTQQTPPAPAYRRAEAWIALIECFEEYYGTNRPSREAVIID